jgi:hypothetical protein
MLPGLGAVSLSGLWLVPLPLFPIYITPTHFSHRNTSCRGATNTDIRNKQKSKKELKQQTATNKQKNQRLVSEFKF